MGREGKLVSLSGVYGAQESAQHGDLSLQPRDLHEGVGDSNLALGRSESCGKHVEKCRHFWGSAPLDGTTLLIGKSVEHSYLFTPRKQGCQVSFCK